MTTNPLWYDATIIAAVNAVTALLNSGFVAVYSGAQPALDGSLTGTQLAEATFGATAFCSFGMFWVSFYLLLHVTASALPKNEVFSAIGLYLWAWAIFTAYMTVASLRTTGAVFAVFLLLTITFIFLGIGNSALAGTTSATNGTIKIGGWIGLATAVVAWYASFAGVLNDTWGKTVLPVFPLTRGS